MVAANWDELCKLRVSGGIGASPTEGQLGALVDYVDEGSPAFAARCSIVRVDGTVLDHAVIKRLASERFASRQPFDSQSGNT